MMSARQLAKLGRKMRAAQSKYYRDRSPAVLELSRRLEREFDNACDELIDQPTLFGGEVTSDEESSS
ncbi:hypothetical protein [Singulisphaera sp. PoT]|uniref:hypothetical protein n=1 Tax=Singulisphaera sp. PoT TaxID=3411797 RepID=UPI003BF56891